MLLSTIAGREVKPPSFSGFLASTFFLERGRGDAEFGKGIPSNGCAEKGLPRKRRREKGLHEKGGFKTPGGLCHQPARARARAISPAWPSGQ